MAQTTIDEKKARAKEWGVKHGFHGNRGGWIVSTDFPEEREFSSNGVTIKARVFGWLAFYDANKEAIEGKR